MKKREIKKKQNKKNTFHSSMGDSNFIIVIKNPTIAFADLFSIDKCAIV